MNKEMTARRLLATIMGPRIFRYVHVPYWLYRLSEITHLKAFSWLGDKAERFEDRFAVWAYERGKRRRLR